MSGTSVRCLKENAITPSEAWSVLVFNLRRFPAVQRSRPSFSIPPQTLTVQCNKSSSGFQVAVSKKGKEKKKKKAGWILGFFV